MLDHSGDVVDGSFFGWAEETVHLDDSFGLLMRV